MYIWPVLFVLVYSTLTYPGGLGKMVAGELDAKEVLTMLFDNKASLSAYYYFYYCSIPNYVLYNSKYFYDYSINIFLNLH